MKKLVNKRNGREIATGEWKDVYEAFEMIPNEYNETIDSISFEKDQYGSPIWISYTDLALAVEMPYGEYKCNYARFQTAKGSYNPETKTVIVYVQDEDQMI